MQKNLAEAERRIEEARRLQAESLDLKDVLMPRNLEVHFEDGFLAVRAALRRRIEM